MPKIACVSAVLCAAVLYFLRVLSHGVRLSEIPPIVGPSTLFDVRYHIEQAARHAVSNGLPKLGQVLMLMLDLVKKKQDEATQEIEMLLREMTR